MSIADYWWQQYNDHPRVPDTILSRMEADLSASAWLVWEDSTMVLFKFRDNSVLVIPEGESAKTLKWKER